MFNPALGRIPVEYNSMKTKMSTLSRVIGAIWLCSLLVYLFLASITYAGEEPALMGIVCLASGLLWIVCGILLVVLFVLSRRLAKTDASDTFRTTMTRWFGAASGGLVGGVAAALANHLFPGRWTDHGTFLPELILFALVGLLVGAIPLAFAFKSRKTVIVAFLLSVAVSWWIITLNFR